MNYKEIAIEITEAVYDEDNYHDAYERVEEILENHKISSDCEPTEVNNETCCYCNPEYPIEKSITNKYNIKPKQR